MDTADHMPILKLISNLIERVSSFQLIKYGIAGAIASIVNLSILYILTDYFNIYYIFSEIIGFLIAVLISYLLNKRWTFKEKIKLNIFRKYAKYNSIYIFTLIINLSILFVLVEYFDIWYILAEFIAIICCFLINFFANKSLTFSNDDVENHL